MINVVNNPMVSALLPFINEKEIPYYESLETEKLAMLVSLAPFVDDTDALMRISNLEVDQLQKLSGELPQLNADERKEYLCHAT